MARNLLVLNNDAARDKAKTWVDTSPHGTYVEFREGKRSLPQNDMMWALLTDVSKQMLHMGRRYPTHVWKILFMAAMGQEVKFIPALDGNSVIPLGYRSSELDKAEMSELIEFIISWGTEHGVIFHDHDHAPAASTGRGSPLPRHPPQTGGGGATLAKRAPSEDQP